MYKTLSEIQKKHFLSISGHKYKEDENKGRILTSKPYNDKEYTRSPWSFSFVFVEETGCFICEMAHRLTNNRIYGWDYEGHELSEEEVSKYFTNDINSITIIKKNK